MRGTVGLRAGVPAVEALGRAAWALPTVTLPWHPGQGPGTRHVPPDAGFASLCDDLARSPHLAGVEGMMTGYLGSPAQANALLGLIGALRLANPRAVVLVDPVIGNERGLYVPVAVATAIRDRLVPLADVVTPNRHELAWLTGTERASGNRALARAARTLGAPRAVVTSAHAGSGRIGNLMVDDERTALAAHALSAAPNSGTGDLLATLLLAHLSSARAPEDALRRATASVDMVMRMAADADLDALPLERAREALRDPDAGNVTLAEGLHADA